MLVFGVPLAWAALWLMQGSGSLWWFYLWLLWAGFSLLMLWAYPTLIAPLFNKFTPLDNEQLKQRIQALLTRCGFTSAGHLCHGRFAPFRPRQRLFHRHGPQQAHRVFRYPAGDAGAR